MSLYDAWLNLRDRCLTSQQFHQFAARFPFTRPVVRKRQSELFDVVSGFVYSQILLACVELDVLAHVGSGVSIEALSQKIGLRVDETRRLAEGAASLRLLQKRGALYRLGDLGAALKANPGVIAMVRHHPALYKDLADPVSFLKTGRGETNLSRFWSYASDLKPGEDEQSRIYSELMATSQAMIASEIIAAYDFSKHKKLLDVGGGHGAFLSAVATEYSALELQLFDLPPVARQAAETLEAAGLGARIDIAPGSFLEDDLPTGADLISLVRIIHDHDDAPAQAILSAAYKALPPGGTLIICEPMLTGGSAERISAAYFNFYLYAMGRGQPRTPERLQEMALKAGFESAVPVKTRFPLMASIIASHKSTI